MPIIFFFFFFGCVDRVHLLGYIYMIVINFVIFINNLPHILHTKIKINNLHGVVTLQFFIISYFIFHVIM
jgi:hypothetical protein